MAKPEAGSQGRVRGGQALVNGAWEALQESGALCVLGGGQELSFLLTDHQR